MSDAPSFHVHEKAERDLEQIFDYSVEQFGFVRAEEYIYKIEQVFRALAESPQLGRRFDPDVKRYLQYPVESHCVFYAVTVDGVDIFRVLHQSMLPTLHL
jgi:toxin ParE1/3/4